MYAAARRGEWIEKLPARTKPLVEMLYLEYDAVEELRKKAEKAMLNEARKHTIYRFDQRLSFLLAVLPHV